MHAWLLEYSDMGSWTNMNPVAVFASEEKGLRRYQKARKAARKRTGHKVQWITEETGAHVSAWGLERLRLREVVIL